MAPALDAPMGQFLDRNGKIKDSMSRPFLGASVLEFYEFEGI
jgi:hypothetical protein